MECPLIDRELTLDPAFNIPINYKDLGGPVDYIYYNHDDGFGVITRVQFCTLGGRNRDIFQCLDESRWRNCPHFLSITKEANNA